MHTQPFFARSDQRPLLRPRIPPQAFLAASLTISLALAAGFSPSARAAEPPALLIARGAPTTTWERFEVLEDPSGQLTFDQLRAPPWSERFRVVDGAVVTPSDKRTSLWLRLRLANPGSEPLHAALEPVAGVLEEYTVFSEAVPEGTGPNLLNGRPALPWAPPDLQVVVPLGPGDERTVYVRLRGELVTQASFRAGELTAMLAFRRGRDLGAGAYYGILFALLIYNFALFLQMRRRMYLHYILALLMLHVLLQMVVTGSFQQLVDGDAARFATKLTALVALSAGTSSLLQFSREILATGERHPKLDRKLQLAARACLGLLPLAALVPLGGFRLAMNLTVAATFLAGVLILVASLEVARAGPPSEAHYFLAAMPILFAGTLVHVAQVTGKIPANLATTHALRMAMLVESLLLSLALGSRVRALLREKVELEQRERQNRRYRDLTRILSHDIANQTAVILNWAHFASKTEDEPLAEPSPSQRILTAARRQAEVIENVRSLQRLEVGVDPVELAPVSLLELLGEAESTFEDELPRKQLRLQIENQTGAANPLVVAEKVSLGEHVLNNLVSNAIKFSPAGATIVARIRREPGVTVVEIIDRGAGIPAELRASLFGDEMLLSRRGTQGERGTGIGLAIAARAAERFGARLGFESHLEGERPDGPGSRFFVRIPDPQPSREAAAA